MALIKHLIGMLAMPLVIALLLGAIAALYGWRRRRRAATWLLAAAALIAYVGSTETAGELLLIPLERQYPGLEGSATSAVQVIVVLGGDYAPAAGTPVTGALSEDSLQRIVEGVRLMRKLSIGSLVVSGGADPQHVPSAQGYAQFARDLGVSAGSIVVLDRARDTGAEARSIVNLIGVKPFVLVTSAYHMPRAMRFMRRAGAQPIPAPTGQRVHGYVHFGLRNLLPSARGLGDTERALHEYVGLTALAMGLE